ncbi:Zinc metalloproteinase nas-14 [Armadillidium vulgare]|nr:Zinc metalloproteinase nas-14 [Armadillidium vulgare]
MAEIESQTCVRFVPKSLLDVNFVYIQKGKDCASNVGRVGGGQPLSLSPRCIQYGIILHELLHALGFWHEQSRYDRRRFVDIHWFNIKPLMLPNFFIERYITYKKSPYYIMSDVGLPYDYDSIMHYSPYTFARNKDRPTISPKDDNVNIGQRSGLSEINYNLGYSFLENGY